MQLLLQGAACCSNLPSAPSSLEPAVLMMKNPLLCWTQLHPLLPLLLLLPSVSLP